jgi:hypothetical protein
VKFETRNWNKFEKDGHMRQARYRFFLLPLFFVLACAGAFAQANSEVTGIVTDQTGAVVAGAKITLTDPATGAVHTTASGSTGLYDIAGLNPANYNLKATAKGFQAYAQTGIVVNISATFRVDVKLTIGAETQTVTVEADALSVQADSNVISTLITSEDIGELATENRNFSSLAALGLGVTNNLPDANAVAAVSSSWAISFNGLSQAHNVWLIDGGESYDRGSGGKSALQPSQDALSEFQVLASNYPPDYGISTGGTISMAIKSGTQKYHGTLWEEDRNTAFDANYFFNKRNTPATPRPTTHYNIYGYNLGGPLYIPKVYNTSHKKTFFFWNEEWRKTSGVGGTNSPTIDPADKPVLGTDLTYVAPKFATALPGAPSGTVIPQLIVPSAIGDPKLLATLTGLGLTPGECFSKQAPVMDTYGKPTCPGTAVIPHALFDANAVLYLNSPILPAPTTGNDYAVANVPLPTSARDDIVRIDHAFNDKWSLMGHWIGESLTTAAPGPFLGWTSYSYNTVTSVLDSPSNGAVIKLTGSITPNLLVEASINYDGNLLMFADSATANKPSGWNVTPVTSAFPLTQRTVLPGITGFGAPYGTSEDTSTSPYANAARDYEPKVDLSYSMGKHAMKYGFSYNRYTKKQIIGGDSQGDYSLAANSGDGMMDMLLGLPASYSQEQSTPLFHWYNQTPSAYALDNWHVTSRLSLQIGLRYDAIPHSVERGNNMSNFVPDSYQSAAAPVWAAGYGTIKSTSPGVQTIGGAPFYMNGMVLAGQGGTPRGLVKNDFQTIQPRIGFSEDLFGNGKTVLRGGYGLFYERMQGNDVFDLDGNSPFANNLSLGNTYFTTPGTSWQTGVATSPTSLPTFVTGVTSINTSYKAPGSAMFSLGVQREVAPAIIWQVQYVGNIDWHQSVQRAINTFPLSTPYSIRANYGDPNNKAVGDSTDTSLGSISNTYVTYPGWGGITQEQNTATASYNSFQTGVRIQNRWGLSGEADYTWAHQIDSTSNSQDLGNVSNPWVPKYDKGSGALDRRQQLSVNYVYKLPFFNKDQGAIRTIAGGWELAGTFVDNTGLVATIGGNGPYDSIGLGGGYSNRPNIAGRMDYPKKLGEWFDSSPAKVYQTTPAWLGGPNLGFGNAGKDAVVGPGRVNFTTSLYKSFQFTERANFQLRFESFNTFNHTEYNGISTGFGSGNFGAVTNTWDPRTLELGGRFSF